MSTAGVAFGVTTRTGSAVVIALGGTAAAPAFAGRWAISLRPGALPAEVYHFARGLDENAAEKAVRRAERAAEQAALAELRAAAAGLAPGTGVRGLAVVVKPVSVPGSVAAVVRSHAWMHAAEGLLYRHAVLAAAQSCGWPAHAADTRALPAADVTLAGIAAAAGRPWRRTEKDAARAALTLLPAR